MKMMVGSRKPDEGKVKLQIIQKNLENSLFKPDSAKNFGLNLHYQYEGSTDGFNKLE